MRIGLASHLGEVCHHLVGAVSLDALVVIAPVVVAPVRLPVFLHDVLHVLAYVSIRAHT